MLGDRLLALGAVVGEPAENVQFRHVTGCATPWDLEPHRAVAVRRACAAVLAEACDVDQVELFRALIKRPLRDAKTAGTLRRDLTVEDLFLLVSMVGGALDKTGDGAAQTAAAKRAHALIIDGISTSPYKGSSRSRRSTSS
jgi:hypothetical protein